MKTTSQFECERCGVVFNPSEVAEAEKHEKDCREIDMLASTMKIIEVTTVEKDLVDVIKTWLPVTYDWYDNEVIEPAKLGPFDKIKPHLLNANRKGEVLLLLVNELLQNLNDYGREKLWPHHQGYIVLLGNFPVAFSLEAYLYGEDDDGWGDPIHSMTLLITNKSVGVEEQKAAAYLLATRHKNKKG